MATINGTNRTALLNNLYYTEKLLGTNASDNIFGLRGDDLIDGGNGNDSLYGGQRRNVNPLLIYLDGRDIIFGGLGNDYIEGGKEDESLPYINPITNDAIASPYVDLLTNQTVIIYNGDSLYGNQGNDRIFGQEGYDYLHGGQDNDYLDGGIGNDTLIGGTGSDILVGGMGSDFLAGGNGGIATDANIDWFVYANVNEMGDNIQDFAKSQDKIVLNASSFGLTKNNLVNATKPFSFSLATQSGFFTNTTQFHKLDLTEYEEKIVGIGIGNEPDVNTALMNATAKIVAIIPNGVTSDVVQASIYYDTDPTSATNYQLLATFTNGNTPTQNLTNTNVFDILIY